MRRIAGKFWLLVGALITVLLLTAGGVEAWLTSRDTIQAITTIQLSEARAAATRIAEYLRAIETQIADVANLPWSSGALSKDQGEEFHRIMKLQPAIFSMRRVDSAGREKLFVSRIDMDRIDSGIDLSSDPAFLRSRDRQISYSPVYFRDGTQPYASLSVREGASPSSTMTVAELNLKFIADLVQDITIGTSGKAYIVDGTNRMIAHPNLSLVLRNVNLSAYGHVGAARAAVEVDSTRPLATQWGDSPEGGKVLVSAVYIPAQDWIAFVEQTADEAMAPVRATLYRTLVVLLVGLCAAALASLLLTRRLTKPILTVQRGAAQIGAGDLNARIKVSTGDEIESLGDEFNRMAERLQESYAGLEAKIAARTQELAEAGQRVQAQARTLEELNAQLELRLAELAVKKEEAEKANMAKTRFLASASHDLRQPMHAISLLVGILRGRPGADREQLLVEKIGASVEAMENLFNSLLDISKLDAGAVRPAISAFPIDSVLQRIELNFAPLAHEKGLDLKVRRSRAIVRTDPALLERIVGNLLANAIFYTERGGVVVGCRNAGGAVRVLVYDTGIGIPREFLADIFDEFFQLKNPERDRSKGLGLGLSIVKRSADLLGHPVIVRSVPGRGSVFGVELPRATASETAQRHSLPVAGAVGRLPGAFVVIVEDDEASRFAMEMLFVQWGCHVVSASSGDEALELLASHLRTPDLIVTDYRLRDNETGISTAEKIRNHTGARIPVILTTGDIHSTDFQMAAASGFSLAHKPVSSDHLRMISEELLSTAADAD